MRISFTVLTAAILLLALAGCDKDEQKERKPGKEPVKTEPAKTEAKKDENAATADDDPFKPGVWVDLFDGKSLAGWKTAGFAGEGKLKVENGELIIPMGASLSGATTTRKDLPTMNYEIELEAQKLDGDDFFCGLTFPVGKSHASLVLGGWGGSICGISSIDYMDAANNETTKVVEFKEDVWYHVKMRVLPNRLQAWLDGEQIVNVSTKDRKVDIRIDISESVPFGVATYMTVAAYKYIRVRTLPLGFVPPKEDE